MVMEKLNAKENKMREKVNKAFIDDFMNDIVWSSLSRDEIDWNDVESIKRAFKKENDNG